MLLSIKALGGEGSITWRDATALMFAYHLAQPWTRKLMPLSQPEFSKLDTVAHVIQLALTPVFLLTGIGTLINVFSTRLARVADQVDRIADAVQTADAAHRSSAELQLGYLRLRSQALDIAVILGAVGGAATCGAVLTLFVGALRNQGVAWALYGLFGVGHPVHHRGPGGVPVRDAAREQVHPCPRDDDGDRGAALTAGPTRPDCAGWQPRRGGRPWAGHARSGCRSGRSPSPARRRGGAGSGSRTARPAPPAGPEPSDPRAGAPIQRG